jgi:hypothetical protein
MSLRDIRGPGAGPSFITDQCAIIIISKQGSWMTIGEYSGAEQYFWSKKV